MEEKQTHAARAIPQVKRIGLALLRVAVVVVVDVGLLKHPEAAINSISCPMTVNTLRVYGSS